VKRWTDFSGLKVLTRRDIKERNAERDARYEEEQPTSSPTAEAGDGENGSGATS
jgi:hypothetical protein